MTIVLRVHRPGYGAIRLTGPGIWGAPADEDAAIRVLRHAVELGVDFVDTAEAYGPYTVTELQEAGKIRHVGLSEVDVAEIEEAREIVDVVSVQNRYHVADRGWERVLDHCEAEGIAFIAWGPLGSGDLSALGPLDDDQYRQLDRIGG